MSRNTWTGKISGPAVQDSARRTIAKPAAIAGTPFFPEQPLPPDPWPMPDCAEEVCFLRLPDVKAITGLSKTSLYALIRANDFPAPVRLGPRSVAWVRSEVRRWALARVSASRPAA